METTTALLTEGIECSAINIMAVQIIIKQEIVYNKEFHWDSSGLLEC